MEQNEFLNQFIQILLPILATFLTGLFTYIGNKLKNAYQEKVNNEIAQAVVKDVVQFVEQVYTDVKGKEKLQKAIEQVSAILKSKGINITEAEIMMLIESAVYGLNEGLTSDLKEALKDIQADTKMLMEAIDINKLEEVEAIKEEDGEG